MSLKGAEIDRQIVGRQARVRTQQKQTLTHRVSGTDLSRVGEAAIGHWSQGAAFSPDGKHIFVGNMVEKEIQVFSLDGSTLRDTGARIAIKGGPAAIRTADK